MIDNNLAYSVNNASDLLNVLKFINQEDKLQKHSKDIKEYIETKFDTSSIIIKEILCDAK